MNHLPILPLLLPLLTGIVLVLLRDSMTAVRRLISAAGTLALIVVTIALVAQVADGTVEAYRLGDWAPPFGIVLVADRLAAIMVLVTAVLAGCVVL